MRVSRAFALAFSLVICFLFAFSPGHAQISMASTSTSSRRHCRFTISRRFPHRVIYGSPAIGHGTTTRAITGCPAPGSRRRNLSCCGRPAIGGDDGAYRFHDGYWGPQIGFYRSIAYGCRYTGDGYEGGYWRNGNFFYNQSVNNIRSCRSPTSTTSPFREQYQQC